MIRSAALLLTVLTGFSGLVYEVAWQRYLATLLGSHSEATASVLAIFLGGLSLGYWLFGQLTRRIFERANATGRPPRLLLFYGVVEASIGLYAFAFPSLFGAVQALSFAIPYGAGGLGFAIDILLATLLVGPASILMGATIPILTQALSRSLDEATHFHALVYALNTFGAFVGALAAGFYLIPQYGLVDVMLGVGTINVGAGSLFILIGLRHQRGAVLSPPPEAPPSAVTGRGVRAYAATALLTGFAVMTIQTIMIRIAGVSFASTEFTFSMVVAVFVLCIALGSFVVSALPRIPPLLVVANQWLLVVFFAALYTKLDQAPYWVFRIRMVFRDTPEAFDVFYVFGFVFLLLVLGLPVLLSGAVLPLLFHQMRQQLGHLGDVAGSLYSWNTLGSLLGALVGGYALLFWLDLDQVYLVAIGALVLAGGALTTTLPGRRVIAGVATLGCLAGLVFIGPWDPRLLFIGVLREREAKPDMQSGLAGFLGTFQPRYQEEVLFHTDDPTTSVVVRRHHLPGGRTSIDLATNGKSDGDTISGRATTGMLGVMPALLADNPRRAFVVGWGIGTTVGELAALDSIERVDVAEISRGVMQAAPIFDDDTFGASHSPKVHVIRSDALRALMRSEGRYDVIVSQPSHIWVAGVETLFSREFLEAAREKLEPGGVYGQWLQEYDVGDEAIALVVRTFAEVFEHVSVWNGEQGALFLFGFQKPGAATDHFRLADRAEKAQYRAALKRAGVVDVASLMAHELLPLGVVHAANLRGPIQSLYYPRLNDLAARGFFRGADGDVPFTGFGEAARLGRENSLLRAYAFRYGGEYPVDVRARIIEAACLSLGRRCQTLVAQWIDEDPGSPELLQIVQRITEADSSMDQSRLHEVAELFHQRLAGSGAVSLERAQRATEDFIGLYHHAAPFDPEALISIWSACREPALTPEQCRAGATRQLAATPSSRASDLDALIAQCLARPRVGARCTAGLEDAQLLVTQGSQRN